MKLWTNHKNSLKTWLYKYYPLFLILLLAIGLRLYLINVVNSDLMFDEMFSIHYSSLPWAEALKYWVIETNPPLYSLLLRFYISLFGSGAITVRLFSLITGLISIVALYFFSHRFLNRGIAIISTFIFTFSSLNIYLNSEVRTYSLLILLSILSSFLFLIILSNEKVSKKIWLAYFFIQLFLFYTHLTALLIPIIQFLLIVSHPTQSLNKKIKTFLANLVAGLFFSIWFFASIISKIQTDIFQAWYFNMEGEQPNSILNLLINLLIKPDVSPMVLSIFTIFIAIILTTTFFALKKLSPKAKLIFYYLSAIAFVPPLLSSFFGIYGGKYFCYSLPALTLLLALGINSIKETKIKMATFVILFAIMLYPALSTTSEALYNIQPLLQYVEKNQTEQSIILVSPFCDAMELRHYYHGDPNNIIGVYPFADELSENERIVRFNYKKLIVTDDELDTWLTNHVAGKDKIFYFGYDISLDNLITAWLLKNDWQFITTLKSTGMVSQALIEFHAPNNQTITSTISTNN